MPVVGWDLTARYMSYQLATDLASSGLNSRPGRTQHWGQEVFCPNIYSTHSTY